MAKVINFPQASKPQVIVRDFDTDSAEIKIQYEHVVNAIAMYLQTMPFALPDGVDIVDVDMGVHTDEEGYITMDIYFGKDEES